jgi:hypothetical protein
MSIFPRRWPAVASGAVLLLTFTPLPAARAQTASKDGAYVQIILKDGFVLQGMVRREGHYEIEEGQAVVFMPSGFFFLDDYPRRQYFSPSLMQQSPTEIKPPAYEPIGPKKPDIATEHHQIPSVDEVLSVSAFDEDWNRTIQFRSGLREHTLHQRVIALTPYFAHTFTTKEYSWPAMYLTRELGPNVVRDLLSSQPNFSDDPQLSVEDRKAHRLRYCDFMIQAGFNDEALAELDRLQKDRPSDAVKTQIEAYRSTIRQLQSRDLLETIKRLHNAGRFEAVRKRLPELDAKSADATTVGKWNELRDAYKAADKATSDATRFLTDLPKGLGSDAHDAALAEASAALLAELQPEMLPRLDAFLGQARQAERQRADGKTAATGPAELLSLAVTGWLGALPDPTPDRAVRLWHARQFVLKYLAADRANRKALLEAYETDSANAATLDDMTRLIPLLPPSEPAPLDKIGDDPVERTVGKGAYAVKYLLQLPPEYRHSRNYPVLIVLHQSGETPEEQLKRWSDQAALNGYIVVAPEWSQGPRGVYGYTEQEHAVVLETLRDLRRHFAVDSDRVFLFGWGQGGVMAYDVGLSHPDLFTGVLPMSCYPENLSRRYDRNAEYLPFYIVDGDRSGANHRDNTRAQIDDWVNKYPMLWIQYKGRGVEFYGGEIETMFDWMHGKKRAFPLEQLGGSGSDGPYFVSHRPTDNRFYWLTTDGIQERCINSGSNWNGSIKPARLEARINLADNTVLLDTSGVDQVTVWLGANGDGVDMVRFDQPLTVRWTRGGTVVTPWPKKRVTRSLETLLEDLAERGDRQRVFTAKLEFSAK